MIKRGDQVKPKKAPYCNYSDWKVRWVYTDGKLLLSRGEDRWVTIVDKDEVSLQTNPADDVHLSLTVNLLLPAIPDPRVFA